MKEYGWAIVDHEGHARLMTRWEDEDAAWRGVCLNTPEMIAEAKASGWRAVRVRIFEVGPA